MGESIKEKIERLVREADIKDYYLRQLYRNKLKQKYDPGFREYHRKYSKDYYEKQKGKCGYCTRYYAKNRERILEQQRKRRIKNLKS